MPEHPPNLEAAPPLTPTVGGSRFSFSAGKAVLLTLRKRGCSTDGGPSINGGRSVLNAEDDPNLVRPQSEVLRRGRKTRAVPKFGGSEGDCSNFSSPDFPQWGRFPSSGGITGVSSNLRTSPNGNGRRGRPCGGILAGHRTGSGGQLGALAGAAPGCQVMRMSAT